MTTPEQQQRRRPVTFEVVPAVDVLEGRVVRLHQGNRDTVTIEGGDPAALARRFADEGAARLHVVDLDGAFNGHPTPGLIETVASTGLPVQIGGGFRTIEALEQAVSAGADRVMVGTAALAPAFLRDSVRTLGSRLVVAIDVRDGKVAVDGWTRTSDLAGRELAARCVEVGVERFLVTSTSRDGSLAGPDVELLRSIVAFGLPVLAAGGIASLQDLLTVRDLGCEGAISGSALLAGRFTLAEALATVGS